jgi:hypothetical protein
VLPTGQEPAQKCHLVALCDAGSCVRASSDLAAPQMCCPQVKILLENVTVLHYAMMVVVYVLPQIWQLFKCVAHRSRACSKMSTVLRYAMLVVVYVLPQIWQPFKCVAHRSRACSKMPPCCIMQCW